MLGVVTGMPLGVVNVSIVDAATAGHRRFATGLGIGGAIADAAHAALAFIGIGQLVTARPALVRGLAIAAAIVIVGYAIVSWRRLRAAPAPGRTASTALRGIATGVALTLPNPAALAAWVAVAAALWPTASTAAAITLAIGVGIGSAGWFSGLAAVVSRMRPAHRALRVIPRVALAVFVGIAVAGVVRVL